ncbi:MAG: polysaccharide lyase 6 family protein, partial [Ginsengibacter sp.]
HLLIFLFVLLNVNLTSAKTIKVSSIPDLQNAINNANPGDVILLTNGVYATTSNIIINKAGTASHPITIAAQNTGFAEITGSGGFNLISPAAYIIIKGFKFTHLASKAKASPDTRFCRFTQNLFETPGDGENLTLAGSDHQVDYNTFQNKNAMGRFIAVRGSGNQIAERLWIHHNYFKSQKDQGGKNGAETLQFGLSGFSLSSSNSIVEYNLFEDCAGENELISVKASAVTLRYNTIRNCPAQFTLRHGNKCFVYGNYFINTPGLRIFGDDHVIHSNYFENCNPAIFIGNGDGEVADGAKLTSHDRPDRVLIAFNTLINNPRNFFQSGRKDGMGATFITIAYNIIVGGGSAASISGPIANATWKGNIIYKTNSAGHMPVSGFQEINPKLERDASAAFHLQSGSPAINAVTERFPTITLDMDAQVRVSPFDIGADEFSKAEGKAHILNGTDVGVNAKI